MEAPHQFASFCIQCQCVAREVACEHHTTCGAEGAAHHRVGIFVAPFHRARAHVDGIEVTVGVALSDVRVVGQTTEKRHALGVHSQAFGDRLTGFHRGDEGQAEIWIEGAGP